MSNELIQLPDLKEIKDMLKSASQDIDNEIKQNPELKSSSQLLVQVIHIIEEKLSKKEPLEKLNIKDKIDVAAHLNFLQCLMEDFFFENEDFEDMDLDDMDFEDEDFEDMDDDSEEE